MEIKAKLNKPYNEKQRVDFIVQYNHQLGYEIKKTDVALEAWGETSEEQLQQAKLSKYQEANSKANIYLQSGEALFEFLYAPEELRSTSPKSSPSTSKLNASTSAAVSLHIEATDGNIAKMTAYALAYVTGQLQPEDTVVWNTKEDETVELNQQQIVSILQGLGQVQAVVWSVKYPNYIKAIDEAQTVDGVEGITINYESEAEYGIE